MFFMSQEKSQMVQRDQALPGRDSPIATASAHFVTGRPLQAPLSEGMQEAMFGMGCFWGVERILWNLKGVWLTAAGYAAGSTPNATYEEVCSGKTGHNEVVWIVFNPTEISYEKLLQVFWEGHDPTQGMRQGNDRGTQYRSGIYTYSDVQMLAAKAARETFAPRLREKGYGAITTEILVAPKFFYAEDYHQQYLAKNPAGYCGVGGTGVTCPVGLTT